LYSQPNWTFFMCWRELTQQKNSDATIKALYNASNVLTLSQTGRTPAVDNPDKLMVCNFDDSYPYLAPAGGLVLNFANAPADSPATGEIGAIKVPAGNPKAGYITILLDEPINPRDYVGISFLAQASVTAPFVVKLEQTANSTAQIQDWNTYPKYTGNGDWQEVHIGFDVILNQLQGKIDANPNFPASNYDRIILVPAPYQNGLSAFTLNIDDIKLRTSWTGIWPVENTDAIIIVVANGTVNAKAGNGAPVSLKVYSVSGQEIANGINQVQLAPKGAYIVKATVGNISKMSKVVV